MRLKEFFRYKNELMKAFCSSAGVVKLVSGEDNPDVPNPKLAYKHIFPFEYIPDTVGDGDTFICFDVDIDDVQNKTFLYPVLYVWVFTHKSQLRLPEGGLRLDELSVEINDILGGSRYFGLGELYLKQVTRFAPVDDFQGRCLVYRAKDFNIPGISKRPPAYRR